MAGATTVSPPIESRADLVETIARGERPRDAWRIGTEHEKHVFYADPLRPVPYDGPNGVEALLKGFADKTGWHPFYDEGRIIGMRNDEVAGGITIEPGGQFELSGSPMVDLHGTAAELAFHLRLAHEVAAPLGIHFLGLGVTPLWSVEQIPAVPKSRYAIMAPYMKKVGSLGTSMMFRTATVQTNLDFASEADFVKKLRVALQPLVTALFANSPFIDGKPSGYLSYRSHIWLHTDDSRTGMLPFAFEDGMGYERYVDYALDVPMYFVMRSGRYVNVAGESFRAFLKGELPQLPGDKPTVKDWENHLSTLFPEVRVKQFLEMRGADMGDAASTIATSALWAGLLYDDDALEAAWDLVKDWSAADRQRLREEAPRTALHTAAPEVTKLRFGTLGDLGHEVVGIATAGLARRARRDHDGNNESIYLEPLTKTLRTKRTPAERWLDLYEREWGRDVTPIFMAAEL